jgi:hypothetical protein
MWACVPDKSSSTFRCEVLTVYSGSKRQSFKREQEESNNMSILRWAALVNSAMNLLFSQKTEKQPAYCRHQAKVHIFLSDYTATHARRQYSSEKRNITLTTGACGSVAVEALCYKPAGRGIASRWGGFFFSNLPNPSGCTMALGSTQPLTEMSTRNLKKETWG